MLLCEDNVDKIVGRFQVDQSIKSWILNVVWFVDQQGCEFQSE